MTNTSVNGLDDSELMKALDELKLSADPKLIEEEPQVEEPSNSDNFSPTLFFENLLIDIYNTYDKKYWTQQYVDEFYKILNEGTPKDLLAWLLAIGPQDVDEYLERSGSDSTSSEGLPYWMTRFRPSYSAYRALLEQQKPIPTPLPVLEMLDDIG